MDGGGLGRLGVALTHAQIAIEALAMAAFAMSGVVEGRRKRLDPVGIAVVAALSAFGGGTLRDLLLDHRPFFWMRQGAAWLWALLAFAALAMAVMRARHVEPTERAMQAPDALGLGLFAAGGAQIALDAGTPALVAAAMATITASFGGVLRDVVCNEIPRLFSDHRPYALCAFAGGWAVVASRALGASPELELAAGALVATGLRAAALAGDWRLPPWRGQ